MDNLDLIKELKRTKKSNTLFVSHYFFALDNGEYLIFYYNHRQYWDKCLISEIENYVFKNLYRECAVFENFDPDGTSKDNYDNYKPHTCFCPTTPKIGNHYSHLGYRIVSHHRYYYFLPDTRDYLPNRCFKINVKDLTESDIKFIFSCAVKTNTPNYIKSIYDLKCFKKQSENTTK